MIISAQKLNEEEGRSQSINISYDASVPEERVDARIYIGQFFGAVSNSKPKDSDGVSGRQDDNVTVDQATDLLVKFITSFGKSTNKTKNGEHQEGTH